jgi:hypothetical protein
MMNGIQGNDHSVALHDRYKFQPREVGRSFFFNKIPVVFTKYPETVANREFLQEQTKKECLQKQRLEAVKQAIIVYNLRNEETALPPSAPLPTPPSPSNRPSDSELSLNDSSHDIVWSFGATPGFVNPFSRRHEELIYSVDIKDMLKSFGDALQSLGDAIKISSSTLRKSKAKILMTLDRIKQTMGRLPPIQGEYHSLKEILEVPLLPDLVKQVIIKFQESKTCSCMRRYNFSKVFPDQLIINLVKHFIAELQEDENLSTIIEQFFPIQEKQDNSGEVLSDRLIAQDQLIAQRLIAQDRLIAQIVRQIVAEPEEEKIFSSIELSSPIRKNHDYFSEVPDLEEQYIAELEESDNFSLTELSSPIQKKHHNYSETGSDPSNGDEQTMLDQRVYDAAQYILSPFGATPPFLREPWEIAQRRLSVESLSSAGDYY